MGSWLLWRGSGGCGFLNSLFASWLGVLLACGGGGRIGGPGGVFGGKEVSDLEAAPGAWFLEG